MNELKEEIKELIDKEENTERLLSIKSMLMPMDKFNDLLIRVLEKSDEQTEDLIPHTSARDLLTKK